MITFRCFLPVATILLASVSFAFAEGDIEYGEYLASQCITCHQAKPSEGGIPTIHGMDGEGFIAIMHLYRSKKLENPTMQTQAASLGDEEISALAAYFATQPEPE